jgi:2-succinyl-6-hydroxy-2,4-cyclohexadiene-1-carboxylate synthase
MKNEKNLNLIFLHGTLQRATVWNSIISSLKHHSPDLSFTTTCPDLYQDNPESLDAWLDQINQAVNPSMKNILIGYSLGGRFALSLYQKDPSRYAGLVLVCTDPGLEDDSKREALLKNDEKWAERFLTWDWNTLMEEWSKLPVFANIPNPVPPDENDFSRESLARLWLLSSKARNKSLWNVLPELACPTLLVTGSLDTKFDETGKRMHQQNQKMISHICFEQVGHRVPWEEPKKFTSELAAFMLQANL